MPSIRKKLTAEENLEEEKRKFFFENFAGNASFNP